MKSPTTITKLPWAYVTAAGEILETIMSMTTARTIIAIAIVRTPAIITTLIIIHGQFTR